MRINVLKELRQGIGAVSVYDFRERSVRADDLELSDLFGSLTLLRTDRGLMARLQAVATVRQKCSRCLNEAAAPVEVGFEEEYIPVTDPETGKRVQTSELGDTFLIEPDFTLDLREGLRQYILVSEPAKPLCRQDCAGLCPTCGANLNDGPCGCGPETDDRWQALATLKSSGRGEG